MAQRIYLVEGPTGEFSLVKASTGTQAVAHVARSAFKVRVATQQDLVEKLTAGAVVENIKAGE